MGTIKWMIKIMAFMIGLAALMCFLENMFMEVKTKNKAKKIYKKMYGDTKYKNVEERMEQIDNFYFGNLWTKNKDI